MGNAICCKPDAKTGYCSGSDDKHVCSMKSYDASPTKYKAVQSAGNRNYQMYAFCPLLSQRACGVSNDAAAEASLNATTSEQVVYSKEMRYRLGS